MNSDVMFSRIHKVIGFQRATVPSPSRREKVSRTDINFYSSRLPERRQPGLDGLPPPGGPHPRKTLHKRPSNFGPSYIEAPADRAVSRGTNGFGGY